MAFFFYLPIFKLNFKNCHCYPILGPATNQNWFKYTFQRCIVFHVLKQDGAADLELLTVGNSWKSCTATLHATTDNQPLLSLYQQSKQDMPAQILHHKLKLQGCNNQLVLEPDVANPSDTYHTIPITQHNLHWKWCR